MSRTYELVRKIVQEQKYKVVDDDGENLVINYQMNAIFIFATMGVENFVSMVLPDFADVTEENFSEVVMPRPKCKGATGEILYDGRACRRIF